MGIVVEDTIRFVQRIEYTQIQVVEPQGLVDRPDVDHLTDFDSLVRRILPTHKQTLTEELSQTLASMNAVADSKKRFLDDYSEFRPRPHAELLVLEYFHQRKFEIIADKR